jgi:hypothetical protein
MPIESRSIAAQKPTPDSLGQAIVHEARQTLQQAVVKISHCLDQVSDQQISWRPHESHNSIQNIVLHLCGNVRQWLIHGVGGEADVRNRPKEFSDRQPRSKAELLGELRAAVQRADAVLQALDPKRLLQPCRVQGFETYALAVIWDSVSHFVGHTHQIVYITRQLVGDSYRFQWVPSSAEQGAPE